MQERAKPPLRTGGKFWGPRRVALGISMTELSKLTGIPQPYISQAESGRMIPTIAEIEKVMLALDKAGGIS